MLVKEIKGDLNKWRDDYVHGLKSSVKMLILPKTVL